MTEPAAVVALELAAESGGGYPEPLNMRMGETNWRRLGNVFGLGNLRTGSTRIAFLAKCG